MDNQEDMYDLIMSGESLSEEEVSTLEDVLETDAMNESARLKLIGYHWSAHLADPDLWPALSHHISWYVQHQPEAEVLHSGYALIDKELHPEDYESLRILWVEYIETFSSHVDVLRNAAWFFLLPSPDIAERIYKGLRDLEPENPEWAKALGRLYQLQVDRHRSVAEQRLYAKKSLDEYEMAYRKVEWPDEKNVLLQSLAKIAFKAGEYETALQYAEMMVAEPGDGWNSGNNVHYGNIVLGHVALARGEKERAASYLTAAGKTKGSPQLNSFGPNMTLAKALYEEGECVAVLTYLEDCGLFWSMDRGRLTEWQQQVESGGVAFDSEDISY